MLFQIRSSKTETSEKAVRSFYGQNSTAQSHKINIGDKSFFPVVSKTIRPKVFFRWLTSTGEANHNLLFYSSSSLLSPNIKSNGDSSINRKPGNSMVVKCDVGASEKCSKSIFHAAIIFTFYYHRISGFSSVYSKISIAFL